MDGGQVATIVETARRIREIAGSISVEQPDEVRLTAIELLAIKIVNTAEPSRKGRRKAA